MSRDLPIRHLWAVGSGWEGPFQLEAVVVAAHGREDALERAEQAFAEASQPVCRAKMRLRDLGAMDDAIVIGPLQSAAALLHGGEASDRRCAPQHA